MKTTDLNLPPVKSNIKTGIGYSPLTERVYLGKQNQKNKTWVGDKRDITNEFLALLNEYIGQGMVREVKTLGKDGSTMETNLFIQIAKDPAGIEKAIKYLQKLKQG